MQGKKKHIPTNDIVFKMLFGEPKNEKTTKKLIEDILEEKVEKITLNNNPYLLGTIFNDKVGIVDVKATINDNTTIDIEMQIANNENMEERILFYWARMYVKQLKQGEKYGKLNRCVSIIFLKHPLKNLEGMPILTKWQIKESKNGKKILTNRLEINIIEMSKKTEKDCSKELRKWLMFIQDPYGEEVRQMAEENEEIRKAIEELDEINNDEAKAEIAELREKYIWDRVSELDTATNNRN